MDQYKHPWPEGVKRTRQREGVLRVLEHAEKPLSAMEICSRIDGGAAWLSTVYRILETFEAKGVIHKISVLNSDMAAYELAQSQHRHYAICLGCHKIVSMEECPVEKLAPRIGESGFHVTGHNLEIYGYCSTCDRKH